MLQTIKDSKSVIDSHDCTAGVREDYFCDRMEHFKGGILNLNPTLVVKIQNLLKLGKQ